MYKQCKTAASSARQKEMADGLLRLMREHNYHDISVADICRELGISRNSFYRYFSDKDAMLQVLIDHVLLGLDLNAQKSHDLKPDNAQIRRVLQFWKSCEPLLDALSSNGLSTTLSMQALLLKHNSRALSDTFLIQDAPKQKYANAFAVGGILTLLISWHHNAFDLSIDEMEDLTRRMLTQPLFVRQNTQG